MVGKNSMHAAAYPLPGKDQNFVRIPKEIFFFSPWIVISLKYTLQMTLWVEKSAVEGKRQRNGVLETLL